MVLENIAESSLQSVFSKLRRRVCTCVILSLWRILRWNARAIVACNQKGGHTYVRGEDYARVGTPYWNHLPMRNMLKY